MADVFTLRGVVDLAGADKAKKDIEDVATAGEKSSGKMSKALSTLGKGAAIAGKAIATGLAVGAAAFGALTVKALGAAGDLEQNMGGSEAVFGKYAKTVQATAKTAWQTMGQSQSSYLATANKMGALFQGAGFTVKASMDMSSKAMQRAADVASIMGISQEEAMEAIAGAAKGNFTMMDNLGVAMNDTSIEAYALSQGINKSSSAMTTQEKIGLAMEMFLNKTAYAAGNYKKENDTLAGSLTTLKAAWSNFLSGAGTPEDLVSSITQFGSVAGRMITEIVPRLITGLTTIANSLIPQIPGMLNTILPALISGAVALINALVAALPQIITALQAAIPQLVQGVTQVITALITAIPKLIPALIQAAVQLFLAIVQAFPQIITALAAALPQIITAIISGLLKGLPQLIVGAIQLLMALIKAIPQIIVALAEAIPQIITSVVTLLTDPASIQMIFEAMIELGKALIKAIPQIIIALVKALGALVKAIGTLLKGAWNGIKSTATTVWNAIKNAISKPIEAVKTALSKVWSAIKTAASSVWNGIKSTATTVWNAVKTAVMTPINAVKTALSTAWNTIKSAASTAWNALKTTITKPIETAKTVIKGIIDNIKGFFSGIKLNLPHIKLPHFSITGKLSLAPPSLPKLSIDWYKQGGIMARPTLFGTNGSALMGGGEAGKEAILPIDNLRTYIRDEMTALVGAQNARVAALLERLVQVTEEYLPRAGAGQLVLDTGALVGGIMPKIDIGLGRRSVSKERGGV